MPRPISHIKSLEDERIDLRRKKSIYKPYMIMAPVMAALGGLILGLGWISIPLALVALTGSIITNYTQFVQPFRLLRSKYKRALVADVMERYHPKMSYRYDPEDQSAKEILKSTRLISGYSGIYEEDVLMGEHKSTNFYFSQVSLTQTDGNGAQQNVFSGLLFRITSPTWDFPKSQIQSKRNLLQRWFTSFKKNEKFDFWYQTQNREGFFAGLSRLFPFIAHLKKKNEDLRIHAEGDQLTILLKSDMDLLDDKSLKMSRSFIDDDASHVAMQQINSLLYIVDAFAADQNASEIPFEQQIDLGQNDEQLELKDLDELRLSRDQLNASDDFDYSNA